MELNWTTFILELVNFVVLIWILNRFLYRPVMNVIAQRKAAIQKTLSEAETTRSDAQALQSQYENRLTEWEQEREKARAQLRDEISAERNRLLDRPSCRTRSGTRKSRGGGTTAAERLRAAGGGHRHCARGSVR